MDNKIKKEINEKIVPLEEANKSYGGKAFGLSFLKNINTNVPNGFALSPYFVEEIADDKEIHIIEDFVSKLPKNTKFAVRSSGLSEDGASQSFAGVYDTKLNVDCDIDSIINAIKEVYSGIKSSKLVAYDSNASTNMGIVIQEMIDPLLAGVIFTSAIDVNGSEVCLVEATEGLSDKLVSGMITPTRVIFQYDSETGKIIEDNIVVKGKMLENLSLMKRLIPEIENVKKNATVPMDLEWCIDKNGKAWLVQARPITKTVFISNSRISASVVSNGVAKGKTFILKDEESKDFERRLVEFPQGSILIASYTDTRYLPAIKKASGIITEQGSILSHAAIVSRELGIPCIVSLKKASSMFPTGTDVILNASNGVVTSKTNKVSLSEKTDMGWAEAYCLYNIEQIKINDTDVLFEFTPNGVIAHLPRKIETGLLDSVELFARKNFHESPKISQTDKYLWYFENKRFEKLPFFNELVNEAKEVAESFDTEKLNNFYEKCINLDLKLVNDKKKLTSPSEIFMIDETMISIHFILDMLLPEGFGIKNAYMKSIPLLTKRGKNFTDLLCGNINFDSKNAEDIELIKIRKFALELSNKRNGISQFLIDQGAMSYDYFSLRDDKAKEALNAMNVEQTDKDPVQDFYNNIDKMSLFKKKFCQNK